MFCSFHVTQFDVQVLNTVKTQCVAKIALWFVICLPQLNRPFYFIPPSQPSSHDTQVIWSFVDMTWATLSKCMIEQSISFIVENILLLLFDVVDLREWANIHKTFVDWLRLGEIICGMWNVPRALNYLEHSIKHSFDTRYSIWFKVIFNGL